MRLGVVSDIHCHAAALESALGALDGLVDQVWCAGDIVLQYRFCDATVELLRVAQAVAIAGNHEAEFVRHHKGDEWNQRPTYRWLAELPLQRRLTVAGRRILMVHGSPWIPHGDYLPATDRRWLRSDELGADLIITGHTHVPMIGRHGSTLVVNPGSVGEPRQRDDRRATGAVVDLIALEASIISLPGRAASSDLSRPASRTDG